MPRYKGKKVDGCTGVPDCLTDKVLEKFCFKHDLIYEEGYQVKDKIKADLKLSLKTFLYGFMCLLKGLWFCVLSPLMWLVLNTIGWVFWFKR